MDFVASDTGTWRMCGLGNGDTSTTHPDIEYAFFMVGGGQLWIYESGISRGQFGTYTGTDHLKVAVENGAVKYYRNGTLLYTSTVAPQYPLLVDTSLNTVNAGVYNVTITGTAPSASGNLTWLVTDQLGTPRMVFDKTGALATTKRHDYLPFGEELFATTGARSTAQGYSVADGVRQKFTQKERDNETGLDYFGERYYASSMGRFTTVDPLGGSARLSNPQSMNRYVFVLNNPLRYVDPDGLRDKDPWDQLEDYERRALASKLTKVKDADKITDKELKAAGEKFNDLTKVYNSDGTLNVQATADNVATAQNFVQNFIQGSPPNQNPVYQQINTIEAIGRSTVEVTVKDKDKFLGALADQHYAVNSGDEYVANGYARITKGSVDHPFDSARAPTLYDTDPELHYGNDRANDPKYGSNYFFAHWDPTSVNCYRGCGPIGRVASGSQHSSGSASPAQVRDYYKRTYRTPVP